MQPLLAFRKKLKNNELTSLKENNDKINSKNFLKFSKIGKKINFHNFYLKEMKKKGKKIKLICRNKNKEKIFVANKVIMAAGTIATTKIIMNFLNFNQEVKINHHPRLISVFLGKKSIQTNLDFTPSILQLIGKKQKNYFSADLRPGNKLITESMLELNSLLYPFKPLINLIKKRLIFSNILLPPKFSNIFMKNDGKSFKVYTKKKDTINILKKANLAVFSFLYKKKIIFPIFKTHFPGIGSDFHYFGTLPINGKSKLSVNEKCQLKNNKNIYIIDSSVFNFENNKYPLGIVMANARRIGKLLS